MMNRRLHFMDDLPFLLSNCFESYSHNYRNRFGMRKFIQIYVKQNGNIHHPAINTRTLFSQCIPPIKTRDWPNQATVPQLTNTHFNGFEVEALGDVIIDSHLGRFAYPLALKYKLHAHHTIKSYRSKKWLIHSTFSLPIWASIRS